MNATIRIRRAQVRAAMTSQCAQLIAALQEGHRLIYASASSRQRAALAGATGYWAVEAMSSQPAALGSASAMELGRGG